MTLLLEPPADWIALDTSHPTCALKHDVSRVPRSQGTDSLEFLDVLETWEGLVECLEEGKVYARILKAEEQELVVFDIETFELGGPIEEGSTFRAQLVRTAQGFEKWRNLPNVPTVVTREQIKKWEQEVAHFADSGL